jgi:Ca2+-binding RTX toxin-like protein
MYGDALVMKDDARGGNDTFSGSGVGSHFGDASEMHDQTRGGDDTLVGGAYQNFGDAYVMDGDSRGGNDLLSNGLFNYGDAFQMSDNARGGNDTLIGSSDGNILVGDASSMSGQSRGGNDILISGTGSDHMWGDAQFINGVAASVAAATGGVVTGADTFVFSPGSGKDDINDFRQSDHDRIDVSAYGFHSLADLSISAVGGNTVIHFDATDSVTLIGISDPTILHGSDFFFA